MRRLCGLGAVLVVLGMAVAPVASAKIVVGQGIAGVKVGDSQARVRQVLGKPASTEQGWDYPKTLMGVVGFDAKRHVNGIWTGSPKQKTSKGIGVGASVARFKRAYPHAHCFTSQGLKWSLVCEIKGRFHRHPVVTTFSFATTIAEIEVDAT